MVFILFLFLFSLITFRSFINFPFIFSPFFRLPLFFVLICPPSFFSFLFSLLFSLCFFRPFRSFRPYSFPLCFFHFFLFSPSLFLFFHSPLRYFYFFFISPFIIFVSLHFPLLSFGFYTSLLLPF